MRSLFRFKWENGCNISMKLPSIFHMKTSIRIDRLTAVHHTQSSQQFRPVLHTLLSGFIIIVILLPFIMISPVHAEITLDGSMGPSGALAGPNYVIGHDLGRLKGTNLFHSFGRFNVMTGESATFTVPTRLKTLSAESPAEPHRSLTDF